MAMRARSALAALALLGAGLGPVEATAGGTADLERYVGGHSKGQACIAMLDGLEAEYAAMGQAPDGPEPGLPDLLAVAQEITSRSEATLGKPLPALKDKLHGAMRSGWTDSGPGLAALDICGLVLKHSDAEAASYAMVGHGHCLDAQGREYESWHASNVDGLYAPPGDTSACGCARCQEVCDQHSGCLGYYYYCCANSNRCIAGGYVIFSRGTRPSGPPPVDFSTSGPYDSPTAGPDFQGSGPIRGTTGNVWGTTGGWTCLKKQ